MKAYGSARARAREYAWKFAAEQRVTQTKAREFSTAQIIDLRLVYHVSL